MRASRIACWVWWLCTICASTAHAWGDQGHRITGSIASSLLNADTRAQLLALIGTDDLSQVASWMDEVRGELEERIPGSARWHYENRTVCGKTRSCGNEHCVTAQIERHLRLLKDNKTAQPQRAEAVRILTHLIGDLHQPLHLADNQDRGGNEVWVLLPAERDPRRLHEAWDSSFVRMNVGRRNIGSYARSLASRFAVERKQWETGNIEAWAVETYVVGKQYAYQALPGFACSTRNPRPPTISLSPEYVSAARGAVELQLAKAGMRIAKVFNDTLGGGSHSPTLPTN